MHYLGWHLPCIARVMHHAASTQPTVYNVLVLQFYSIVWTWSLALIFFYLMVDSFTIAKRPSLIVFILRSSILEFLYPYVL